MLFYRCVEVNKYYFYVAEHTDSAIIVVNSDTYDLFHPICSRGFPFLSPLRSVSLIIVVKWKRMIYSLYRDVPLLSP
jgi:hypothetical protein